MSDDYSIFVVGDRVAIDGGAKRGTLRYLGSTKFRPGMWAGIALDNPEGKHDGAVEGERYFSCSARHGIFVHPSKLIHVGGIPLRSQPNAFGPVGSQSAAPNVLPAIGRISTVPAITETPVTPNRRKSLSNNEQRVSPIKTSLLSAPGTIASQRHNGITSKPSSGRAHNDLTITTGNRTSLQEAEDELRRRQVEVSQGKAQLDALRSQFIDPQDASEFVSNRDSLLDALDIYEKALARHDRQLKRVSVMKIQEERNRYERPSATQAAIEQRPDWSDERERYLQERVQLIEGLEKAKQRNIKIEESLKNIEDQYDLIARERETLKRQLQNQSALVAEINLDRSMLRKELIDLKARLTAVFDAEGSFIHSDGGSGSLQESIRQLNEENSRLSLDLQAKEQALNDLSRERDELNRKNKDILTRQLADLESVAEENSRILRDMQAEIDARDEIISDLKRQLTLQKSIAVTSPSTVNNSPNNTALMEELEKLRIGKEMAQQQVRDLQKRLAESRDISELENNHRVQLEAVRKHLDENWTKFNKELSEKDEEIQTLRSQLSHRPLPSQLQVEKQFEELKRRYEDLRKAKETEETFFATEISKLRKYREDSSKSSSLIHDGRLAAVKSEFENELRLLNERLERVTMEKDRLREARKPSFSFVEPYEHQNEVEELRRAKDQVEIALVEEIRAAKTIQEEVNNYRARLIILEQTLTERSDMLSSLEAQRKEDKLIILNQLKALESLKKEYFSKVQVLETEMQMLKRSRDEANLKLSRIQGSDAEVNRLIRDKKQLTEEIEDLQTRLDSLQETLIGPLEMELEAARSELTKTSMQLVEAGAKIKVLEEQLEKVPERLGERTEIYKKEIRQWRDLVEDLGRTGDVSATLAQHFKSISTHQETLQMQIFEQQNLIEELDKRLVGGELRIKALQGEINKREIENVSLQARLINAHHPFSQLQSQSSTYVVTGELDANERNDAAQKTEEVTRDLKEDLINLQVELDRERTEKDSLLKLRQDEEAHMEIAKKEIKRLTEELDQAKAMMKHRNDMIELAERELVSVQAELNSRAGSDEQNNTVRVLKEQLESIRTSLEIKEREIQSLQHALKAESSSPTALTEMEDSLVLRALEKERDHLRDEKRKLEREQKNIEHEKMIMEKELASIKEQLRQREGGNLVASMELINPDQRELLLRAGRVLEELAKKQDSWSLLNPLKSLAAFARIYKPAEVDLDKLRLEYDQVIAGLESSIEQPKQSLISAAELCTVSFSSPIVPENDGSLPPHPPVITQNFESPEKSTPMPNPFSTNLSP